MTDWNKIEDLVKKLSDETGVCHVKLYGEMIKLEEKRFDEYLLKEVNDARFVDSFYHVTIGEMRKEYREQRLKISSYMRGGFI